MKAQAKQNHEEILDLPVKNKKMIEERRTELLAKIEQVTSNDLTAFDDLESDIKLIKMDGGNILVEFLANQMMSYENANDQMDIHISTWRSLVKKLSLQHQQKCHYFFSRIVYNSMERFDVADDAIRQTSLKECGSQKLDALLQ